MLNPIPTERPRLSDRAESAIKRCSLRVDHSIAEIETMLRGAKLPVFPEVVGSFYYFGDHLLSMGRDRTFKLYSMRDAIHAARYMEISDEQKEFRIPFGNLHVAPMWFLMDGYGTLYTDDNPVSESIIHWIEQCALSELVEKWNSCFRVVLPSLPENQFEPWADSHMQRVNSASDIYSTWWLSNQATINRFTTWSSEQGEPKCVWLFAMSRQITDEYVRDFEDSFGLNVEDIRAWPP